MTAPTKERSTGAAATRPARRVAWRVAGAACLAVTLGACGSSNTTATSEPAETSTQAHKAIVVSDPWSRATAPGAQTGAIYAEIHGGDEADALVGATVPAGMAAEVQLHVTTTTEAATSTTMADMSGHDMGSGSSGMGMQQVASLGIPAGGTLTLAPGSNHIMLIGLTKQLTAGESFPVTLQFERAPEQTITVEVRDS